MVKPTVMPHVFFSRTLQASLILGPLCSLSLHVSHFVILTPTKYMYNIISFTLDAYNRYIKETGAVTDEDTGLLRISQEQYDKLQSFFLDIGGNTYELIPNAQIWSRALNELLGGKKDHIYLVIQDIGEQFPGLDFIAGMVFLERHFSVYDTQNHRLGLAPTQYTKAEIN